LLSYKIAATLQPNDPSIENALHKTRLGLAKDKKADNQIPWVGAGVGIIVAVTLVIADHIFTHKPTLVHPFTMAITTILIAMVGYGLAFSFRYYIKTQRSAMLDPPPDLFGQDTTDPQEEEKDKDMKPRYSKAQARHRFKKGKS
jgi:RsiW-degrading membrane proteinase PrsW (M82 family)